jgi:hypothetical protein
MAGLGLVYVLRWFWWRVNAWSELAALGGGVTTAVALHLGSPLGGSATEAFAWRLIVIVAVACSAALAATLLTAPEPPEKLGAFYRRVRPPALLWGPVAREQGPLPSPIRGETLPQFGLAVVAVFTGMFGLGKVLLGEPGLGLGLLAVAAVSGGVMLRWALSRPSR